MASNRCRSPGALNAYMPDGPVGLSATTSIATVVASGVADPALLMACATTFVVDFDAVVWDEMDGFDVTLS